TSTTRRAWNGGPRPVGSPRAREVSMPETDVDRAATLQRLRSQRDRLRDRLRDLEDVEPTAVAPLLDPLRAAFDDHVEFSEGPDRLFVELRGDWVEGAPEIDRLCREHVAIRSAIDQVQQQVDAGNDEATRAGVRHLTKLLHQHRQRGADLLYNAYNVDVAAGD